MFAHGEDPVRPSDAVSLLDFAFSIGQTWINVGIALALRTSRQSDNETRWTYAKIFYYSADCAAFSAESIAMCYVHEETIVIVNILLPACCLKTGFGT